MAAARGGQEEGLTRRAREIIPVGAWRRLVAHTLGVRVVAGSNPAAPTNSTKQLIHGAWPEPISALSNSPFHCRKTTGAIFALFGR